MIFLQQFWRNIPETKILKSRQPSVKYEFVFLRVKEYSGIEQEGICENFKCLNALLMSRSV